VTARFLRDPFRGDPFLRDGAAEPRVAGGIRSPVLQTLDLHCGGEPLRWIQSGFPEVPVAPILERRRWFREHADHVRRVAMYEPRGHRDMYGAVLLPPSRPDADLAVLFMHNEGYSTMCGHGTIALAAALVEQGYVAAGELETRIRFEAPAGLVVADVASHAGGDGRPVVDGVRFTNVPSYLAASGLQVDLDGRSLTVHIGFGGAYYGIVDAAGLGLRVVPAQTEALTRAGAAITDILRRDHTPAHPTEHDMGFVYGTIIVDEDPATSPDGATPDAHIRNVTIFAEAEVDRSPCGSGTSALLAERYAHGRLMAGRPLLNASITGALFEGRVESETTLGPHPAVVTTVAGMGYVIGRSTLVVDPRDRLGAGFLLR
jgi:proline racemase